jgi:Tfp pilus assembly protein PilE
MELIIVLAIIGILSIVAIPVYLSYYIDKGQIAEQNKYTENTQEQEAYLEDVTNDVSSVSSLGSVDKK